MVAYTYFQAHVTLKIALNIQVNVSYKACAGTGLCTSFNKVYLF